MQWSEVIREPTLRNLPFKIELSKGGAIEMTPASNKHGRFQAKLTYLLSAQLPQGEVISECSVQTDNGVRVADVAWASDEFIRRNGYDTPYLNAPEICVEILSPSNGDTETAQKSRLYLQQGAKEVWLVQEDGKVRFLGPGGEVPQSAYPVAIAL